MVRMDEELEMKWIAKEAGEAAARDREKRVPELSGVCVRVSPLPRFASSTLLLTTSGGSLSGMWTQQWVGRTSVADIKGVH